MIRYCCDMCRRELDPDEDLRYVVRMEVYAAIEPRPWEDDDRDHLQEIQEVIEQLEDLDNDQIDEDVYRHLRFDLCPQCYKKFLKNPLGRETARVLDFSDN